MNLRDPAPTGKAKPLNATEPSAVKVYVEAQRRGKDPFAAASRSAVSR
jgi:hypothetical protein